MNVRHGLWLMLGATALVLAAIELQQRRSAGPVLLHLGRSSGRLGVFLALLLFAALLVVTVRQADTEGWFDAIGMGGAIGGLVLISTRRIEIRQAGLLGRGATLLRWEKIAGYEVTAIGSLTLKLRTGRSLFYCDVPVESRAAVRDLLASKVAS